MSAAEGKNIIGVKDFYDKVTLAAKNPGKLSSWDFFDQFQTDRVVFISKLKKIEFPQLEIFSTTDPHRGSISIGNSE